MTPKDTPNLNYGWVTSNSLGKSSIFDYRKRIFHYENKYRYPLMFKDKNYFEGTKWFI